MFSLQKAYTVAAAKAGEYRKKETVPSCDVSEHSLSAMSPFPQFRKHLHEAECNIYLLLPRQKSYHMASVLTRVCGQTVGNSAGPNEVCLSKRVYVCG